MFSARLMKDRITLRQRRLQSDGAGGQIEDFTDEINIPAYVKQTGISETIEQQRFRQTPIRYDVTIRMSHAVHSRDKIVHNAREFEVETVSEHPENDQFQRLKCRYDLPETP